MNFIKTNKLNPNPITKFLVVGFLGITVIHSINSYFEIAIIFVISFMYFINGLKKEGIKNIIVFSLLFFIPNFTILQKLPFILKMIFSLLFVLRMFYIPYSAGKFLIKTSDVGSIISSMDYLRIPNIISIPVAVMFRFFPSFKEERNNIKMAMRIRGIKIKNPIKYLEYVVVPLLIISSNIADDIAKSAETRCIANPVKKTRYITVSINLIDFIYAITIIGLVIGGLL
ncbi:energy-coupling factor transporter transmembrane component T family protein [Streptobacillus notomytis]|uniref:energy-coupling factor transporter transmembrane component T family protein n=1 Tax=Streptobacillus notomytis TaxID=1712031 RepID=UPI000830506E|nr:energy-coupling factor transporter transmembrane component T [Streptobacillus notomytis]